MKKGYVVLIALIFAFAIAYGSFMLIGAIGGADTLIEQDEMDNLKEVQSVASEGSILSRKSYSGDDIYDPAAMGPAQFSMPDTRSELPFTAPAGSFSGDDAYDPAIGGPAQSGIPDTRSELPSAVANAGIQAKGNAQLEAVISFDAERGELPEGITIDKAGNMYVSLGPPFFVGGGYGAVLKISPDGTETTVLVEYPVGPAPAGLAVDPPGNVYFALTDPGGTKGGGYRLTGDGDPERLPGTENMIVPNGLAFDKQGNLFVSDSVLGAVWRIPPDGSAPAEIWLQHELVAGCTPEDFGANGVAFWKGDLYVANTGRGALVHVPVMTDGSPGEPAIVAGNLDREPEGLFGMDGIALDVHGKVYALLVLQNKLVRINPTDRTFTTLLTEEDGLWNAASIAFGTGKGDRESIFISNYAVLPPEPTNSLGPAVLKYDVSVPGLPLP